MNITFSASQWRILTTSTLNLKTLGPGTQGPKVLQLETSSNCHLILLGHTHQ